MILPAAGQGNANVWKLITHNCLIFSLFNLFEIENTGQITCVTMERLKRISCFINNIICSSLAHFFTLPSGRCLGKTWESCRLSKAEEKVVAQATVLSQILSSMEGFCHFSSFECRGNHTLDGSFPCLCLYGFHPILLHAKCLFFKSLVSDIMCFVIYIYMQAL